MDVVGGVVGGVYTLLPHPNDGRQLEALGVPMTPLVHGIISGPSLKYAGQTVKV